MLSKRLLSLLLSSRSFSSSKYVNNNDILGVIGIGHMGSNMVRYKDIY